MNFKKNGGFTLVELIVVIAILGLLAGIGIPQYSQYVEKAQIAVDNQNVVMLHNAFVVACVGNEVDPATVTAVKADWRNGNEFHGLLSVTRSGTDPIVEDFNSYVDEPVVFKQLGEEDVEAGIVEGITESGTSTGNFGKVFDKISESISGSVGKVQNSTFGTIGAKDLMNKVNTVTDLAAGLAGLNTTFKDALSENIGDLGLLLLGDEAENYTDPVELGQASLAAIEELIKEINPEACGPDGSLYNAEGQVYNSTAYNEATNQILANYAVLQAAKSTTKSSDELLTDLQSGINSEDIKNLMSSKDTANTQEGLSKAAMMYAMYTAYANQMPETTEEEKAAKTEALEAAKTTEGFLAHMNDDGFNAYLQNEDGQAKTDLEGYLGALDIINKSAEEDKDAVADLMVNGYSDPSLVTALQGLLGK